MVVLCLIGSKSALFIQREWLVSLARKLPHLPLNNSWAVTVKFKSLLYVLTKPCALHLQDTLLKLDLDREWRSVTQMVSWLCQAWCCYPPSLPPSLRPAPPCHLHRADAMAGMTYHLICHYVLLFNCGWNHSRNNKVLNFWVHLWESVWYMLQ